MPFPLRQLRPQNDLYCHALLWEPHLKLLQDQHQPLELLRDHLLLQRRLQEDL